MTPQQAHKEAELQQQVDMELLKELQKQQYCVKFPDSDLLSQALSLSITEYSPDSLRCDWDTFKSLLSGKSPNEFTFYEMQIALNCVAAAPVKSFRNSCYSYIEIQEYVRQKAADWNKTVAVMRKTLENKHKNIQMIMS